VGGQREAGVVVEGYDFISGFRLRANKKGAELEAEIYSRPRSKILPEAESDFIVID
jgi:hypothetical protein